MIMELPMGHPSPYAMMLGTLHCLIVPWVQVIRVLGLLSVVSEKGKRSLPDKVERGVRTLKIDK